MKANELRFGNLILGEYYNDQDIECEETVKFLGYDPHEQWYWVEGSGNIERYSGFKPIPLTEEWLLKFGFVYKNGYGYMFNHGWIRKKDMYWVYHSLIIKIHYVHQLQNLYFALTGEELTIK